MNHAHFFLLKIVLSRQYRVSFRHYLLRSYPDNVKLGSEGVLGTDYR